MRHFMEHMYPPERIIRVAHEELLVELADKHFSSFKWAPVVDDWRRQCHCPVHPLLFLLTFCTRSIQTSSNH